MANNRELKYELFDDLVKRNRGLIRRLCWRHSSGNEALCEELVQDCYVAIWYHLASLRSGVHALQQAAWVAWQCRSVFSHRKRHTLFEWLPISEQLIDSLPASSSEADLKEIIEDLATGLNDKEHRILSLILQGFAQREIAEKLEATSENVGKIRQRIIQKMQQQYDRNITI